jgi:hypothetical protein
MTAGVVGTGGELAGAFDAAEEFTLSRLKLLGRPVMRA